MMHLQDNNASRTHEASLQKLSSWYITQHTTIQRVLIRIHATSTRSHHSGPSLVAIGLAVHRLAPGIHLNMPDIFVGVI